MAKEGTADMTTDKRSVPTKTEIEATTAAIEAHLNDVRSHPDQRPGSHPYYLFHPPNQPIYGTVMMFHGFSMRPHQMWRLADYLFHNGFNVYQLALAGHDRLNPHQNWPQIDLKPEYAAPLMQKVLSDPVLAAAVKQASVTKTIVAGQQHALLQRAFTVAPEMKEFATAISQPGHPNFERYFASSHRHFLTEAQQRLDELSAMPGPIYTVGLSVGGATALGLAGNAGGRIEKVVAYAPLLKIEGEARRTFVQLTGPLNINETGWDPNLQFPIGALTAADYFGSEVRANPDQLKDIPLFMVLTENEDAADVATDEAFFEDVNTLNNASWLYKYPTAAMVPHPMIDPTEVSQGMSNLFWQGLYQETLRFLKSGTVSRSNLATLSQSGDLPPVQAVIRSGH
ncbi:MAG: alpha/beta hydrolase [Phormidesmis sp.]